jgi:hypothetical protein
MTKISWLLSPSIPIIPFHHLPAPVTMETTENVKEMSMVLQESHQFLFMGQSLSMDDRATMAILVV